MIEKIRKIFHLKGLCRVVCLWFVNHIYAGDSKPKYFAIKRRLLIAAGLQIGEGTKIVGPIYPHGKDNCDIGPEVTFQTGGHEIGTKMRRAGKGLIFNQCVGDGTWIGGRVTILNNTTIGQSCVIAGCACVVGNVEDNVVVGGVPAHVIKKIT